MSKALLALVLVTVLGWSVSAQERRLRIAILQFGDSPIAKKVNDEFRRNLVASAELTISDAEMSSAAAKGIGYSGSLNLNVNEARDLGAALDADYYFIGDSQTLRRSSSQSPIFFESYCSLFMISSRTGQLMTWDRLSFQNNLSNLTEEQLVKKISSEELRNTYLQRIKRAVIDERNKRALIIDKSISVLEAPEDEKTAAEKGLQLPRPYRRLRPAYPITAAQADAEATVDVLVDVGVDGEVNQVQIARWAGFGLDETTVDTVRRMHFFPAQQNGSPVAMRVLLRYNFRKSQN